MNEAIRHYWKRLGLQTLIDTLTNSNGILQIITVETARCGRRVADWLVGNKEDLVQLTESISIEAKRCMASDTVGYRCRSCARLSSVAHSYQRLSSDAHWPAGFIMQPVDNLTTGRRPRKHRPAIGLARKDEQPLKVSCSTVNQQDCAAAGDVLVGAAAAAAAATDQLSFISMV